MSIVLKASDIQKIYKMKKIKVQALKTSSFSLSRGSINVVIGRSGSGKSTLLKVIGGLSKPDSGDVEIDGLSIYSRSEAELARLRSTKVGFVFQSFNLIHELSVINNIRLPFDINQTAYQPEREAEVFNLLDIKPRLSFYPDQLSGGERQRVAIARALLMRPSLVLMDEPTGNLDKATGQAVIDFVRQSNQSYNQTFVIVTHDHDWLGIADQVFQMRDGHLTLHKEALQDA